MKYRNIVVSGDIGTGKSTLARNLAKAFDWTFLSMGKYFREWHEEHKIPVISPDEIPAEMDREMDEHFRDLMKNQDGTVFESHLAGYLAKDISGVFKVLCVADFRVRAMRAAHRDGVAIIDAEEDLRKRSQALIDKFKKLYGVENSFDPKYFDLVVDTTEKTPEEVEQIVLDHLQ